MKPLFRRRFRRNPDRRERRGLLDRDLAGAAQIEQSEERDGLLDPRELAHLLVEVEARPAPQDGAEPLDELRHRREAQRHVRERHLRRLDREHADHLRELLGLLRRERRLDLRRERRRPEPEEPVALGLEPLPQPAGRVLHPPVLGEPPRELLGRGLRLELGELRRLLREETARLQLEERGDEHEELAARLEIELVALERAARGRRARSRPRRARADRARPSGRGSAGGRTGLRTRRDRARAPGRSRANRTRATGRAHAGRPSSAPFGIGRGASRLRRRRAFGGVAHELPPDEEGDARDEARRARPRS